MKILIFTKNWLGDILFQFPAIQTIRNHYPHAEIVCAAPRRCVEMLESNPAVDRVLVFDEKDEQRSFWKRLKFGFSLRQEHFDQGYLLHRSRTRAFLLWMGGVRERIGYAKGRKCFLTRAVPEPPAPLHHVDYFLEMLTRAGLRSFCSNYRFYLSPKDSDRADALLSENRLNRYACFHLGANWEPKRWPTEHFAKLADILYEKWGMTVVLTGGPDDQPLAESVIQRAENARMISLIGKTSLAEVGRIFEKSLFVVSGDSGPMHIASGVGARVVALFGPTHPDWTGPRGTGETVILKYVPPGYVAPWYGKTLPSEGWLSHIRPEEVAVAIETRRWYEPPPVSQVPYRVSKVSAVKTGKFGKVKNVLVVTLSNIGDVVLTTPVIMTLAACFPAAKMTVVVGPRAKGVLEQSRYVHRLIVYDKKAGLLEKWRFLRRLRETPYDLVVDLKNTAIPFLVSTKHRSSIWRSTSKTILRNRHLEVLEKMGISAESLAPGQAVIPPFDFYSAKDEKSVYRKLKEKEIFSERGWIVVAPIAASRFKSWRLDGFREVMRRLLEERSEKILIVGSEHEKELAGPLTEINPMRVHNLAGETTLPELAFLVSRASLLLANDSSLMHLGCELGVPVVAVFGPTARRKALPESSKFRVIREPVFCSPCEKAVCRLDRQICFEDLRPEKVFEACMELLHADQT